MKRHTFYQVTLLVPHDMPDADVKDFITTALMSEPGMHRPEDHKSQVEVRAVKSKKEIYGGTPCG